MKTKHQPEIGVAVFCIRNGKLLVARRRSGKLNGQYACPGGHLKWMETFIDAAVRELREETGLIAAPGDCSVVSVDQGFAREEHHCWVVINVEVAEWRGEPCCMEPKKQGPWEWRPLGKLPRKTMETVRREAERQFWRMD
jgi:8-oxo-dGTP diphosphatase